MERWAQAAVLIFALQLISLERINTCSEGKGDWGSVITLAQEDGAGFKAVVQPIVEITANSYRYPEVVPVKGWTLIDAVAPAQGGMHATLYEENRDSKRLVLSFRGTDISGDEASMADLCADDVLWITKAGAAPVAENCSRFSSETLDYYKQAVNYTEQVMRTFPDSPLLLTGHSLGAGLALLVTATLKVSPSLPVIAFSAPGVAKVLKRKSLTLEPSQAKRLVLISDMWDEIVRTTWEDQVGITCLYPTDEVKECKLCFEQTGTSITHVQPDNQNSVSKLEEDNSFCQEEGTDEDQVQIDRFPGFTDACWTCFLETHILLHLMGLVDLGKFDNWRGRGGTCCAEAFVSAMAWKDFYLSNSVLFYMLVSKHEELRKGRERNETDGDRELLELKPLRMKTFRNVFQNKKFGTSSFHSFASA
ncbi:hypothetical protein R1sor_002749 [Riccia sorocarpa]|uniref:Fungal lipase-type domain-containing protein n=1 Tax=Riccia sorocarpa TaxID=122646 RepID=A0ABD3H2R9_9MARC